jgi:hypothetical protein
MARQLPKASFRHGRHGEILSLNRVVTCTKGNRGSRHVCSEEFVSEFQFKHFDISEIAFAGIKPVLPLFYCIAADTQVFTYLVH